MEEDLDGTAQAHSEELVLRWLRDSVLCDAVLSFSLAAASLRRVADRVGGQLGDEDPTAIVAAHLGARCRVAAEETRVLLR